MLAPPLLAAYFLCTGLSLFVLAFLLYRQDPSSPELRVAAIITAVLGAVALVVALLGWREVRLAARHSIRLPLLCVASHARS
jgi:heme A synthase